MGLFKKKPQYPDGLFYVDVDGKQRKFRLRLGNGQTKPDETPYICNSMGLPIEIWIRTPREVLADIEAKDAARKEAEEQNNNSAASTVMGMMGSIFGGMSQATTNTPEVAETVENPKPVEESKPVPDDIVEDNKYKMGIIFSKEFYDALNNSALVQRYAQYRELKELIEKYYPEYKD